MKKSIIVVLLGLFSGYGFSQVKLSGRFIDGNGRLVPYVNVLAFVKDSTHVKELVPRGVTTNGSGAFTLDLPGGTYILRASLFGKKLYERKLVLKHTLDLGAIQVKTGLQLGEVSVSGQKKLIEQKVDRLVFNVEDALAASGGDALDALKITPGLRVENDKISMIGKGSLRVLVDGRILPLSGEDLTSYLQSILADDIKSIEVITTPPAKYEAEGDSGLINIIYKKGRKNSWNASLRNSYYQGIYASDAFGGTFSYSKNKLSLLFNTSAKTGAEAVIEQYHFLYPREPRIGQMDRKDKQDYLSGRIALDYKLSEKTAIGFQYAASIHNPDIQDATTMNIYSPSKVLDSTVRSNGFNDQLNDNHSLNLHYLTKLDTTGKTLSLDLDYFKRHAIQDRKFVSQPYLPGDQPIGSVFSGENTNDQSMHNYSAKVDVVYPTKWAELSYGAKVSFTGNDNTFAFFKGGSGTPVRGASKSDRFQYNENTQALYCSASKKMGGTWQAKMGLRLEHTRTEGISKASHQTHRKSYVKVFPTLYVTHTLSEDHTLSLSYGKRVQRPSYWELDPSTWYITPSFYARGNPSLQPSFTDNFEFFHTWKDNLTTRASFSVTTDGFGRVMDPDYKGKEQVYRDQNYFTSYKYRLSESYTFKKYSWWQSSNYVSMWYSRSEFDQKRFNTPKQNGLSFYIETDNTLLFNPSHTFLGEINFWYQAPGKHSIFESRSSSCLSLGLKSLLLNKKLVLYLGVRDVFKASSEDYITYVHGVKQFFNSYFDNRYLRFSISYKFGNDRIKVRERAFGNEEEKQRAGG